MEPWHLSYRPLAQEAEHLLTPALLLAAWQDKEVAGAEWLERHLPSIFSRLYAVKERSSYAMVS